LADKKENVTQADVDSAQAKVDALTKVKKYSD